MKLIKKKHKGIMKPQGFMLQIQYAAAMQLNRAFILMILKPKKGHSI